MFCWAPLPEQFKHLGSVEFSKRLMEKRRDRRRAGRWASANTATASCASAGGKRAAHPPGRAQPEEIPAEQCRAARPRRRSRRWRRATTTLRVGIAGLGTVGGGLLKLLQRTRSRGRRPAEGRRRVGAQPLAQARRRYLATIAWFDDPVELAANPDIDVFVELIGGSDGPAKRAVEVALKRGAHVVTANKALVAEHGAELAALAEKHGGAAAVRGGGRRRRADREGAAGKPRRRDACSAVSGILNGTCNYLLTEMESLRPRRSSDVLADAQRLGYAEADPTMDVGGFDAAHKIAILAAIAFGFAPDFEAVDIEGVEQGHAARHPPGRQARLPDQAVAKAERTKATPCACMCIPRCVAFDHPLASVGGSLNAVVVDAEPMGRLTFIGRGAGEGPTAAAVAADLLDLLEGRAPPCSAGRWPICAAQAPPRRADQSGATMCACW